MLGRVILMDFKSTVMRKLKFTAKTISKLRIS